MAIDPPRAASSPARHGSYWFSVNSRPFALLRLVGLDEKRRQLGDRIAGCRLTRDRCDVYVEPCDRCKHVPARGAVFEEMADLLHLGDPAIGFRIHPRHLSVQPGEEMRLTCLELLMQRRCGTRPRRAENHGDRDRGEPLGDATVGHLERRRGADRTVEWRECYPEVAQTGDLVGCRA